MYKYYNWDIPCFATLHENLQCIILVMYKDCNMSTPSFATLHKNMQCYVIGVCRKIIIQTQPILKPYTKGMYGDPKSDIPCFLFIKHVILPMNNNLKL